MEFTNFEAGINAINDKISNLFNQLEELRSFESEEFLKVLEGNLEKRQVYSLELENNLKEKVDNLRLDFDEINKEIDKLDINKIPNIHNIDELRNQINDSKQESLRDEYLSIKKKKIEVTHKVTALRKELANFHKENSNKLLEEEKLYKLRETEFERRLNIDIERETDANIKSYNDLEKNLLETNDEDLISDLQKKIKAIRVEGLENIKKLKDKYAYLSFEDSLEFEKFREKVILENGIKLEENKIMVHGLETEKTLLEEKEEWLSSSTVLDTVKELVPYELENELNNNDQRLALTKQIIELKKDGNNKSKDFSKIKRPMLESIVTESYDFDISQLALIVPHMFKDKNFLEVFYKNTIDLLKSQVRLLKGFMFSYLEKILASRVENNKLYNNYFSFYSKDKLSYTNFEYINQIKALETETNLYYNELFRQLKILKNGINGILTNILMEYGSLSKLMNSYLGDLYNLDLLHLNRVEDILGRSQTAAFNEIKREENDFKIDANIELKELKKNSLQANKYHNTNEQKIREKYILKLMESEGNIAINIQASDNNKEKIENESRDYVTNSRNRIIELKQISAANIQKHEKRLHDIYKETVVINEAEKRSSESEL